MTSRLSLEKLDRVVIHWDREGQGRYSVRCILDVQAEMTGPWDIHIRSSGERSGIHAGTLKYLKP